MTQTTRDFVAEALAEPIANIGQIDADGVKALKRAIKNGKLASWRGKWFPWAGAPMGLGPDKTCYGKPEMAAFFASIAQTCSIRDRVYPKSAPPRHDGQTGVLP